MNKQDKDYIRGVLKTTAGPKTTAAEYEGGRLVRENRDEAERLISSPDYRAGWRACHAELAGYLENLLADKTKYVKELLAFWTHNRP